MKLTRGYNEMSFIEIKTLNSINEARALQELGEHRSVISTPRTLLWRDNNMLIFSF